MSSAEDGDNNHHDGNSNHHEGNPFDHTNGVLESIPRPVSDSSDTNSFSTQSENSSTGEFEDTGPIVKKKKRRKAMRERVSAREMRYKRREEELQLRKAAIIRFANQAGSQPDDVPDSMSSNAVMGLCGSVSSDDAHSTGDYSLVSKESTLCSKQEVQRTNVDVTSSTCRDRNQQNSSSATFNKLIELAGVALSNPANASAEEKGQNKSPSWHVPKPPAYDINKKDQNHSLGQSSVIHAQATNSKYHVNSNTVPQRQGVSFINSDHQHPSKFNDTTHQRNTLNGITPSKPLVFSPVPSNRALTGTIPSNRAFTGTVPLNNTLGGTPPLNQALERAAPIDHSFLSHRSPAVGSASSIAAYQQSVLKQTPVGQPNLSNGFQRYLASTQPITSILTAPTSSFNMHSMPVSNSNTPSMPASSSISQPSHLHPKNKIQPP